MKIPEAIPGLTTITYLANLEPMANFHAIALVASGELPKKTLEEAMRIASVIKDDYAGKLATWEDIANSIGFSASSKANQYLLWSATAYGIIEKTGEKQYRLTEIGRKILSPTYENEDTEGKVIAIGKPAILARFYSDYSTSTLPPNDIFRNVLEQKYSIPTARVDETIQLILDNAKFAGLLEKLDDGRYQLRSGNSAIGVGEQNEFEFAEENLDSSNDPTIIDIESTDYKNACFIITPIGEDSSEERKHADAMLRHLIEPVLKLEGIKAIRADKISKPGHITKQVVEHIAYCKLCITDLSFKNQNAHYELGIRHALILPSIQIIRKGDKIPFDVSQGRTIIIDTSDPYTIMDRIASAKAELSEHVNSLLSGSKNQEESPITMYLPKLAVKIG